MPLNKIPYFLAGNRPARFLNNWASVNIDAIVTSAAKSAVGVQREHMIIIQYLKAIIAELNIVVQDVMELLYTLAHEAVSNGEVTKFCEGYFVHVDCDNFIAKELLSLCLASSTTCYKNGKRLHFYSEIHVS